MKDRRTDEQRRLDLETGADPTLRPAAQVQARLNNLMTAPKAASEKKTRLSRKPSEEIRAMNLIEQLLEPLTTEAKCRVLTWLSAKIQEENRQKYCEARAEDIATQNQFGAQLGGLAS